MSSHSHNTRSAGRGRANDSSPSPAAHSSNSRKKSSMNNQPGVTRRTADDAQHIDVTGEDNGEEGTTTGAPLPSPSSTDTQSAQLIASLLGQINQQNNQIAQQHKDMMSLVHRSPSTSPPRDPRPQKIDLSGVIAYSGDAGAAFLNWTSKVQVHHDDYVRTQGVLEKYFVARVATTLDGAALTHWQDMNEMERPQTWGAMKLNFSDNFQVVTTSQSARRELMELQQTNKQNVVEYSSLFRKLLKQTGETFKAADAQSFLVERFLAGLRDDKIRRELEGREPPINTLDTAIRTASRMDVRQSSSSSSSSSASSVASMSTTDQSLGTQLAAMTTQLMSAIQQQREPSSSPATQQQPYQNRRERGANKTARGQGWKRVPGMTAELAAKRQAENKCLWCASKEHRMYDCADRVNKRAPNLSTN